MMTAVRWKALAWMLSYLLMLCPAGLAADIVIVDVRPDRAPVAGQEHRSPASQGKEQASEPSPKPTYLVQYIDHDGTILSEVIVAEEEKVAVPSITPKRPGSVFLYWYDEATTGGPSIPYVFGAQLTGDLRLHAFYAEIPQKAERPEESTAAADHAQPSAGQRVEQPGGAI